MLEVSWTVSHIKIAASPAALLIALSLTWQVVILQPLVLNNYNCASAKLLAGWTRKAHMYHMVYYTGFWSTMSIMKRKTENGHERSPQGECRAV